MQGRLLTAADLEGIRALRAEHPQWSRQQLSVHLAQGWAWRNDAGRLKDMAARTLLLKLQARGLIDLPAPRTRQGNHRRRAQSPPARPLDLLSGTDAGVRASLDAVQPVQLERVDGLVQRRRVTELLRAHHYRGYSGAVGDYVQLGIMRS